MNKTELKKLISECIEEISKEETKDVVLKERKETYYECPHCGKEIYEKHTYVDGDFMSGNYIERHSDCKGAIKFPKSKIDPIWEKMFDELRNKNVGEGYGYVYSKDIKRDPKHISGERWTTKFQSEKDLKKHGDKLSGQKI